MSVDLVVTGFAEEQFGDDAADVTRGVIRAILAAQRSALDAQEASGLEQKFAYGAVWSAKFANLVAELGGLAGAEIVKVRKTTYSLVKLRGRLLVPFRHATELGVPITQAKIGSDVLRSLTDLSVPRPPRPFDLFDTLDEAESDGSDEQAVLDPDTTVIYIGIVANADSPSVLGAWWGIGEAQTADGELVWSPERLPLEIIAPGDLPSRIPQPRAEEQAPAFNEGPAPDELDIRPRPADALADDELPDDPAVADDRE